MKKLRLKIFLLISSLVLSFDASCQNAVGGKIGINLAKWVIDDDDYDYHSQFLTGINGGMAFQIGLGKKVAIQTEFQYLQKGERVTFINDFDERQRLVYKFTYLELPVLIKIEFPVSKSLGLYFNAGPSIGYAVGAFITSKTDDSKLKQEINLAMEKGINRIDLSLAFGSGLSFKSRFGIIFLETRKMHGFSNLFLKEDGRDEPSNVHNRSLGFTLGFLLPIE
jgi:hypothetical protein